MSSFGQSNPGQGFGAPRYPGTFMLALREAIGKLGWQAQVWRGTSVECVDAAGAQREIGLENLYRRLRREPRESWPDLVAELLGSVPAEAAILPDDLNQVAEQIMVRLGPPVTGQNAGAGVWSRVLVDEHLAALLVIDYPSSMSYVSEKMIASSGHDSAYWYERALANLHGKSGAACFAPVHDDSGLLQAQVADAYDSSRALLLDLLQPGHDENGFYVIVPSRDHCFVLPVTPETLMLAPWLRTIATKMCKDMPYPISPELFWVRGGFWHHFAIEHTGEDVLVKPPAAFVEVMARLRPDMEVTNETADDEPEQDDSGSVSF
jgi:hypothetical protein